MNIIEFINVLRTFTMFQFDRFSKILGKDKMQFLSTNEI